jgi:CRISPR type I-D-associated protein Csc2
MSVLERLQPYTVDQLYSLIGAETIQIVLLREILDYTVLRTEETRELNTVTTPRSIKESESMELRVAFLASKQKAAESRMMEQLLRTATRTAKMQVEPCYLKDYLCMNCPRCALYGATNTRSASDKAGGNIKHRIEYGTAFSLMPTRDISDVLTFNAIDEMTQTTGQALGARYVVKPATVFPSIVTLKSVTRNELVLTLKTLLACKSYGAESRTGGDARNTICGIICGWEEVITPLELTLELYDMRTALTAETVQTVAEKYKPLTGNQGRVVILEPKEIDDLVTEVSNVELTPSLLTTAYEDVKQMRKEQAKKR